MQFGVRIAIRFRILFLAQDSLKFLYFPILPDMCFQVVVIGVLRIIKTLNSLYANRAWKSFGDLYSESYTCRQPLALPRIEYAGYEWSAQIRVAR